MATPKRRRWGRVGGVWGGPKMAKNGQKWPKMAKNGQKMAKNAKKTLKSRVF